MSTNGKKPDKPASKKKSAAKKAASKKTAPKKTAPKKSGSKGKSPQAKAAATSTSDQGGFGIGMGDIFKAGFGGFFQKKNALILTLAGLPVLIVFAITSIPWLSFDMELRDQVAADPDASLAIFDQLQWIGLLLVAAFPAGIVSAPWFRYALDAADGREIDVRAPLIDGKKWLNHTFATFWFWAGITVGLRYSVIIPALPSILVLVLYPFYGYIIADGREINGLKALGVSVRMGAKKRLGLAAIAGLFFIFNIFGAVGFGVGLEDGDPTVLGIVLGILGIAVSASITLVSGAAIYRALEGNLNG